MKSFILILFVATSAQFAIATSLDTDITPGAICTPKDPDFIEYRYSAHIAYCKRNVSKAKKKAVAEAYGGIPESEWKNYEFDHLIPLNAGGSSAIENIWPEPLDEAKEKDKVELATYKGLKDGSLTQDEAIQMIWDWVDQNQE
jgi:hypothetical protein